jgi:hypothetical protein
MAKMNLSLGALKELDNGLIERLFNRGIQQVIKDCMDRPGLDKTRKVTLTVTITPVSSDANGESVCRDVAAEFAVAVNCPAQASRTYQLDASPNGQAIINPASPDIRQGTLDDAE